MKFKELPVLVKASVALSLFNTWVLFEETIVDRTALAQWLPFYRIGKVCAWDFIGAVVVAAMIGLAWKPRRAQ